MSINNGVPQRKVFGPMVVCIFINDVKAVRPNKSLLVKIADDITLAIPINKL